MDHQARETEEVTADRTDGNVTRCVPRGALSAAERAAIRNAGAEDARRSRVSQGLPDRIEDLVGIAVLAALLRTARSSRMPGTIQERTPAA
jgi:hypothetical protein